jgi:PAS domain S-box-containing protein
MEEGFCTIEVLFDQDSRPVDFRFLEVNPAFEKQTGIQKGPGRRMLEIAPLHEEYWFQIFGKVALTGESIHLEREAAQLRRWYQVYAFRVGEPEERKVGIVFNDITDRRLKEAALQRSEEDFRTMANAMPQLAWMANPDGWIYWYNEGWYKYTGTTPKEMEGWGWQSVHDPVELPKVMERWQASIAAGESFEMIFPLRGADGELRSFLTRIAPLKNEDGKVLRWFGTNTDVDEQKRVEEALQASEEEIRKLNAELEVRVEARTAELAAANKELESFSYSVSHDLRAPLRAISGFSSAVLEDYGPSLPAEGQQYLQTIRRGAERMGALMDDLLAFSRLGRQEVTAVTVNSRDLVSQCIEELQSAYENREVEFAVGELLPCQGDRALLKQVWMNLLANAVKFTAAKPKAVVQVGTKLESGEAVYFVKDNGAGFDMKYANKLFGVFQRLHSQSEFAGTGVGLAIVQRIVHRHGGRVWADATPNQGATFYFTVGKDGVNQYE